MKKLTTILIICLLLLSTMPASAVVLIVDPPTIVDTLKAGETERDTITVNLPTTSPKGDVVFIFDASGSMSGELNAMKTQAGNIMTQVRTSVPDTNFGVGSFVDYPHAYNSYGYSNTYGSGTDYAWRVDQDLTSDETLIPAAFSSIVIKNGNDGPQNYVRALYEGEHAFAWRADAKKIIVIFGDAPPHAAPSGSTLPAVFMSGTYGGDPGRDEIMFTADDLDFKPVVQSLADNNFIVIAVDSAGSGDATRAFQYEADMTGGSRFYYTSSGVGADIVAKINAATSAPIDDLVVVVREPEYASWVTVTPPSYSDVPWGESRSFAVEITPPIDTITGTYTIHLDVFGDGVLLGTTTVTKDITGIPGVPEFPTLAFPVAMMLGFVFLVYSIRSRKED